MTSTDAPVRRTHVCPAAVAVCCWCCCVVVVVVVAAVVVVRCICAWGVRAAGCCACSDAIGIRVSVVDSSGTRACELRSPRVGSRCSLDETEIRSPDPLSPCMRLTKPDCVPGSSSASLGLLNETQIVSGFRQGSEPCWGQIQHLVCLLVLLSGDVPLHRGLPPRRGGRQAVLVARERGLASTRGCL